MPESAVRSNFEHVEVFAADSNLIPSSLANSGASELHALNHLTPKGTAAAAELAAVLDKVGL